MTAFPGETVDHHIAFFCIFNVPALEPALLLHVTPKICKKRSTPDFHQEKAGLQIEGGHKFSQYASHVNRHVITI